MMSVGESKSTSKIKSKGPESGLRAGLSRTRSISLCLLVACLGFSMARAGQAAAPSVVWTFDAEPLSRLDLKESTNACRVWDTMHLLAALQGLVGETGRHRAVQRPGLAAGKRRSTIRVRPWARISAAFSTCSVGCTVARMAAWCGLAAWEAHCRRYFTQWDMTITGFILDGASGASTDTEFAAYARFAPDGAGTHFEHGPALHASLPTCPERDLPDSSTAAARVIAEYAKSAITNPKFLWARGILKPPAWYAEVSRELREHYPEAAVAVVDPYTFFGLIRLHLAGAK
jgi:hypothetical protein